MRSNTTFTSKDVYVEIPEVGEVKFWGDIQMVDNGIGAYEFWGAKGVDTRIEPEVQDVHWEKNKYTTEENNIISDYLDNHQEEVDEQLCEDIEPPEDDYPEPDDYPEIERD